MRTSILLFGVVTTTISPIAAQDKAPPSLYAIENVTGKDGVVDTHNLVRVYFDKQMRLQKDFLRVMDSRFFSHVGPHFLVDNRYVATRTGNVIDLENNRVIHVENSYGALVGGRQGSPASTASRAASMLTGSIQSLPLI